MMIEGKNTAKSVGDIEALRTILESQRSKPISYDEAAEIGESLLIFFETLSDDDEIAIEGGL